MVQNVSYVGLGMASLLGANGEHGGSGGVCWTLERVYLWARICLVGFSSSGT